MKKLFYCLSAAALLLVACEKEKFIAGQGQPESENPENSDATRMSVKLESELTGEISALNQPFQLQGKGVSESYIYKAYANQPIINGTATEATSIVAADNWLFVSWHTEGTPYGGAISAYENTGSGYVYREVLEFTDSDWHDLAVEKSGPQISVYAAGQRNPDSSSYFLAGHRGAVVAKIDFNSALSNNRFNLSSFKELPVQGFAANGVAIDFGDNSILAISGGGTASNADTSGIYRIPMSFSNVSQVKNLDDGQFIERDEYNDRDVFVALSRSGSTVTLQLINSGDDLGTAVFQSSSRIGFPAVPTNLERNGLAWNGPAIGGDKVLAPLGFELWSHNFSASSNTYDLDSRGIGLAVDAVNEILYVASGEGGVHVLANPGYNGGVLINDYDIIGKFIPPTGGAFPGSFYAKDVSIYQEDNISIATGSAGVFFVEKQ